MYVRRGGSFKNSLSGVSHSVVVHWSMSSNSLLNDLASSQFQILYLPISKHICLFSKQGFILMFLLDICYAYFWDVLILGAVLIYG